LLESKVKRGWRSRVEPGREVRIPGCIAADSGKPVASNQGEDPKKLK